LEQIAGTYLKKNFKKIMKDLTTKEGRVAEMVKIENSFLTTLRANGFDIAPDAVCRINKSSIELGIAATGAYADKGFKMAFASDILLYSAEPGRKENEINFGSSGRFTPEVRESYWRTIHAASLLKNWKMASEIINTHCRMYAELEKECFEKKV
jgi:hypothetical protein